LNYARRRSVCPQQCDQTSRQAKVNMQHHKPQLEDAFLTRREFLCRCGMGMGALSLATFFDGVEAFASTGLAEGGYV